MLNFELEIEAKQGKTPGYLQVNGEKIYLTEPHMFVQFTVHDLGYLKLYFSKSENDTVIDSGGNIVADTEFRILNIRCDKIKLERWITTDLIYCPDYFQGYLSQFPDAPAVINSPYQFNFPGSISLTWSANFWDWYFEEKNKREVISFLEKDPDRVWKFRGSLDPCDDLVVKIKDLIKI